ncbi:MAG: oxygen-independent coproporphyrinogen III oxidase [Cyclobacteriaceae bacterium]|nr:oxygen-independent coproporphyrinogen III oxidase [Cyclobacteriaceae bacterium]MCH8517514.1 oxygen-independent coproporphyrinogen III oxidase [Cyclobacteriaceae bacterium]
MNDLARKYNVPVPRYTSYPTVPYWENTATAEDYFQLTQAAYLRHADQGVAIYIHLPFCESLCTYCGCSKRITKNHEVERPYIDSVLKEWNTYRELFGETIKINAIHLGGGTPTFFSAENLKTLIEGIIADNHVVERAELSFEGHPNNTKEKHLKTLYDLGFRRVSFGIQDFDEKVQLTINRVQPYQRVKEVVEMARKIGYNSINFDLIYGLPYQTEKTISDTIEKVSRLMPDRIAFYNYAHLPQAFPAQKSFEKFLPTESEKKRIYEIGKTLLNQLSFHEVGMDHFALASDELFIAIKENRLHRNFMGYTCLQSKLLIGLGASSISDTYGGYMQNVKGVEEYKLLVLNQGYAFAKAHIMTERDIQIKELIADLICHEMTTKNHAVLNTLNDQTKQELLELKNDGLIQATSNGLKVNKIGVPYLRNICKAFDERMQDRNEAVVFSKN